MAKRVAILPGNGCSNVRRSNWYGWLAKELTKSGIEVALVDMPDPNGANEKLWIATCLGELGCDERTVVVGHSSGAACGMRLAESIKLGGLVLVSAYHTDLGWEGERAAGYFSRPWLWADIIANTVGSVGIIQYGAADDCFLPLSEQEHVATNLRADFIRMDGRSHYMDSTFPELLQLLRDKCGETTGDSPAAA
ncbi:putative hydrolase rbbp9 [Pavlovales sp. CCMP2436]|nr:putative hydrolase rbbp9 [Pavlovales sp. CCMP2436]|eukprot:CAMPEP_0180090270 /NCGR_PEP_ID=MMETSP0985-20121206/23352_1 /TAXON_ID=483367 /ORGANISM="non described non described, Strain CCMP 2436" /LENGTH=193 /DNA_ID=CAMNT_0022025081 /DNA_START=22 /DNA_END=603 /DNA_ORIENTATION=+